MGSYKEYFEKCKKKNVEHYPRFLGSDENNFTTTLGREGSDYTRSILPIV
jgi:aspartate kinase